MTGDAAAAKAAEQANAAKAAQEAAAAKVADEANAAKAAEDAAATLKAVHTEHVATFDMEHTFAQ